MPQPIQAQGLPRSTDQVIAQYGPEVVSAATTVVLFLASFAVFYYVGRPILVRLTRRSLESRGFKSGIVSVGVSVTNVAVLVGALALAATVAGFGMVLVAFTAIAGALVLAVGFATQDIIANFVAGVFILKDEPFRTGDWIEWDGNVGVVREITIRITKLDTFDNELVTVPNSDLANSVVTNPVANDTLRVTYDFGIDYGDDIDHAQQVITDVGQAVDGVLTEPAPTAPVTDLGDSAVVLQGRVWIDPDESGAGAVKAAFVTAVKERFDEEGIDMPYPHTEVTGGVEVSDRGAVGAT